MHEMNHIEIGGIVIVREEFTPDRAFSRIAAVIVAVHVDSKKKRILTYGSIPQCVDRNMSINGCFIRQLSVRTFPSPYFFQAQDPLIQLFVH